MSAIDIKNLTVKAGAKTLINDVTLSVEAGTWLTIIGPNGAGKTSLVETVAGIRKIDAGSIAITGQDIGGLSERERARLVALVPQNPFVPSGMSVRDYVALGRTAYHGMMRAPSAGDRAIVDSVIERLSLQEFAKRNVATLSGGERQRMVHAHRLHPFHRPPLLPQLGADKTLPGGAEKHVREVINPFRDHFPRHESEPGGEHADVDVPACDGCLCGPFQVAGHRAERWIAAKLIHQTGKSIVFQEPRVVIHDHDVLCFRVGQGNVQGREEAQIAMRANDSRLRSSCRHSLLRRRIGGIDNHHKFLGLIVLAHT